MSKCSLTNDSFKIIRNEIEDLVFNDAPAEQILSFLKDFIHDTYEAESIKPDESYSKDKLTNYIVTVFVENGLKASPEEVYRAIYYNEVIENDNTDDEKDLAYRETPGMLNNRIIRYKYGSALDIGAKMLKDFIINIRKAVLYNIENQSISTSIESVNLNLRQYQEKLWDNIKQYLKLKGIIYNDTMYGSDGYLKTFEAHKTEVVNILTKKRTLTGEGLKSLNASSDPIDKAFIKAYNSYVILENFDEILKQEFGNTVTIKNNVGTFTTNNKYNFGASNKLRGHFKDNEYTVFENELDNINKVIIESIPIYNKLPNGEDSFTDTYMQVKQFTYIIAKIKSIPDYILKSAFIKNEDSIFNDSDLKYFEDNNINTLYDLKAHSKVNPVEDFRYIFKYLDNVPKLPKDYKLYRDDIKFIHSIYKELFSDTKSLYSLYGGNNSSTNYYNYIVQAINSLSYIKYIQDFIDEDGDIKYRELSLSAIDKSKRVVEEYINGKYSILTPNYFNKIKDLYDIKYDKGTITLTTKNGSKVEYSTKNRQVKKSNLSYDDIYSLFTDTVGIVFNDSFREALNLLYTGEVELYGDLLRFSLGVLSSGYFKFDYIGEGNTTPEDKYTAVTKLKDAYSEYFKRDSSDKAALVFNKSSADYNVISKNEFNILNNIVQAYNISRGLNIMSTAKDSDGNDIGTISKNRLFREYQYQMAIENTKDDSIFKNSLIVSSNLLKDIEVVKELSEEKDNIDFTPNETYYESLVLDYYSNLSNNSNIKVHPFVIADKNIVVKGIFDTNVLYKKMVSNFVNANFNNDSATLEGISIKKYKDDTLENLKISRPDLTELTPAFSNYVVETIMASKPKIEFSNIEGIHSVIKSELGNIHKRMLDNIIDDWKKLENFINEENVKEGIEPVIINPLTDFKEFNERYSYDDFINYISLYQKKYPKDMLVFRDQMHYINIDNHLRANRNLIAMVNRFTPEYFVNKGIDINQIFPNYYFSSYEGFVAQKERELLSDLLQNNFEIDLLSKYKGISEFKKDKKWVDSSVDKAILAKVLFKGEKSPRNIRTIHDLKSLEDLKHAKSIELNPLIRQHNWIDYLLGQELLMSIMGTPLINPTKVSVKNYNKQWYDYAEESERNTAHTKRNVTASGSMDLYQIGNISGILPEIKYSTIPDLDTLMFNYIGDGFNLKEKAKVYDGATFVPQSSSYLFKNSLEGQHAEFPQKPLMHDMDSKTGSVTIIKTAAFPISNYNSRRSVIIKNLNKKSMLVRWTGDHDVTEDYNKKKLKWKAFFKRGDKYFLRYNLTKTGKNTYSYMEVEVDQFGEVTEESKPDLKKDYKMYSNYDLFLFFGGIDSVSFNSDGVLSNLGEYGEASQRQLAEAMNKVGTKLKPVVRTIHDVHQPLKESMIHMLTTYGAIKKGAGNINKKECYTDNSSLLYQTLKMEYSGIQLDKTHDAEAGHLSILTQVINALGSRGYTEDQADSVYKALETTVNETIKVYMDSLKEFRDNNSIRGKQAVINEISKLIIKNLSSPASNADDIAAAVVSKYSELLKEGVNMDEMNINLPISDPAIFNKLLSIVSSSINSVAIRMNFNGMLSILTPSHYLYKLFNGKQLDEFADYSELVEESKKVLPINISEALIGTTYDIYENGKRIDTVNITDPYVYWDTRSKYDDPKYTLKEVLYKENTPEILIKGEYYYIDNKYTQYLEETTVNTKGYTEIIPIGRDLAAYNVTFSSDSGEIYNLWDLDIVHRMWDIEKLISKTTNPILKGSLQEQATKLRQEYQNILNNIENKNFNTILLQVKIKDEVRNVTVSKSSIKTQQFECILPNKFLKEFGIEKGTVLSDITEKYFYENLVKNRKVTADPKNYDVAIKQANGKHLYIMLDNNLSNANLEGLYEDTANSYATGADGNIYVENSLGQQLYRVSSNKDKIYNDISGNTFIRTANIRFFLKNYDSIGYVVSPNYSDDKLNNLWNILSGIKDVKKFFGSKDNIRNMSEQSITVTDEENKRLIKHAKKMYISFKQSLKFLAARIPSQSMQSFMAMKCVGFDNLGINNVYVNPYQIWLQGSDFDIDTVSMLGYTFSKNGTFLHWSPLASYNSIESFEGSLSLPFPTGEAAKVNIVVDGELIDEKVEGLFNQLSELITDKVILDTKEKALLFSRILKETNGKVINITPNDKYNLIIDAINTHNAYITTLRENNNKLIDVIKNFISHNMFDIISNVVNNVQAMSSIDKATSECKGIAGNTEKAKNVTRNQPGNAYNKGLEQSTNISGKAVIGITAASMKALLGISHASNKGISNGDIAYVTFNKTINGITYTIAGNTYSSTIDDFAKQALLNVKNDEDIILILSALLSLATDNAKELVLDKINAGQELVSLYVGGISLGMKFTEITDIMISDSMNNISRIMKGNLFNDNNGFNRFDQVLKYIETGPSLNSKDLASFSDSLYNALETSLIGKRYPYLLSEDIIKRYTPESNSKNPDGENPSDITLYSIYSIRKALSHPDIVWDNDLAESFITALKSASIDNVKWNRAVESIRDWVALKRILESDRLNNTKVIDLAKELYECGAEINYISRIFKINQGASTSLVDILKYKILVEDMFNAKYKNLSSNEFIKEKQLARVVDEVYLTPDIKKLLKGNSPTISNIYSALANYTLNYANEKGETKLGNYGVSLNGLMTDISYRQTIINFYNALKNYYNVPYVVFNNNHYVGYLSAFNVIINSTSVASSKFDSLVKYSYKVLNEHGSYSGDTMNYIIKAVDNYLSKYIINKWLDARIGTVVVPEGVTIVDPDGKEFTTTTDTNIVLGTNWGNKSFKMYFENKILPDLQKGLGPNYPIGNIFINNLQPVVVTRTISGNAEVVYSLPIEMIPKTPEELSEYGIYTEALLDTASYRYNNRSILDYIYLYNMIAFGGRNTQYSLTRMFTSTLLDGSLDIYNDYLDFVKSLDKGLPFLDTEIDLSELLYESAPIQSIYSKKSSPKYIKDFNNDSMKYVLYKNTDEGYEPYIENLETTPKVEDSTIIKQIDDESKPITKAIRLSEKNVVTLKVLKNEISIDSISIYNPEFDTLNTLSNTELKPFIKNYNKSNKGYTLDNINDLLVFKDINSDSYYNLDVELTNANIERLIFNPCK